MTAKKRRASCKICSSPHVHEINAARLAGCSLDAIAEKYKVHRMGVWRHCADHLSNKEKAQYLADVPLAEVAERAVKEGGSILSYLALIRSSVISQMLLAAQTNDGHRTAVLAGRGVEVLTAIGKFSGQLSDLRSLTVNNSIAFINSPVFSKIEALLLDRLKAHPALLADIVAGLDEIDAEESASSGRQPPLLTVDAGGAHAA